jgi:hypothetical protein
LAHRVTVLRRGDLVAIGDKRTLRGHSKLVATDPWPTSELREPKASQPEGLPNPLRTDTLNRYHALS